MSETPKYEPPFIDRVKWAFVNSGWLPGWLHERWKTALYAKLLDGIFGPRRPLDEVLEEFLGNRPFRAKLRVEYIALDDALAELLSLLPELPERVHEAFHGLIDTPEGLKRLVALDVSPGSTFTGEMVIRLDPTDGLRMFLAAIRTGEFEDSIVEDAFGHIPSPQPDSDHSSVSRGERIAQ